ncbi:vacuolar protein sorting-associated protein 45 [Rhizophlyctis rosea]|nr:vacuolar protein sorting-associated protein 45 [Rhizophlyctis rosea]
MDVIKSIQNYINKLTAEVTGMKVLLLDAETTAIISVVMTQSQLLAKEVYLIDRVDNSKREKMRHLKCICFLRPTGRSVQALVEELRDPCYGDYYLSMSHGLFYDLGGNAMASLPLCSSAQEYFILFNLDFSNSLKKSDIERLAEADEHEAVRELQEYFADYLAINPDLYSLNVSAPDWHLFVENSSTWDTGALSRVTEGILSVLLSLKKKPLIRYEKSSTLAKKLAAELTYQIQQEGPLFDFRRTDTPPILLLMDRRNDPVTPLLSQWTYQAMVHELIGITNGRVDLSHMPDVRPEIKEVVLSIEQDTFYNKSMFLNLGDLGANIKSYVDEYQVKHKSSQHIESIADMKKFVEDYPEFRKLSGNVTKHVTLVGELSRLVAKYNLMEVGELEQSLAVTENHAADLKNLKQLIERPNVPDDVKVRLVLLYALRYEKSQSNATAQLVELLARSKVSEKKTSVSSTMTYPIINDLLIRTTFMPQLVKQMLQYAGSDHRLEDIFSNQNVFARTRNVFRGLKGVENVYTQHTPHLVETLQECIKGRLKDQLYPFFEGSTRDKPQDIIIFMIGGTTYAEAREVSKLNSSNPGVRIILGGSTIHNGQSFMTETADSVSRWHGKSNPASPAPERLRSVRAE